MFGYLRYVKIFLRKMKLKLSLILVCGTVSICALSACGPTKEEKAQKMAADYLNGILYHSDSYEPLQTKVDSSFVALSSDKEAIEQTFNMLKLIYLTYEYAAKIESAEESMEIWYPDGYSSRHSKGQYRRAKEDRDNYQHLLDKTKDRIRKQFDKLRNASQIWMRELLMDGKYITDIKASTAQERSAFQENLYSFVMNNLTLHRHIRKTIMT